MKSSTVNLQELSDRIDGLLHADFNTNNQDASCSRTVQGSEPFCVSTDKASKPFLNINSRFVGEHQIEEFGTSEEIGALRCISQWLLEEDADEKTSTYEEELALLATVKAFDDIISQEYYSAPDEPLLRDSPPYQIITVRDSNYEKSNPNGERELVQNICGDPSEDPTSTLTIQSFTAEQIQKGIDDAKRFLPNIGEFFPNRKSSRSISGRVGSLKNKNSPDISDMDRLVGRASKQIVTYSDQPIRNEIFDKVLLLCGEKNIEDLTKLRRIVQKEMRNRSRESQAKVSNCATEKEKNLTMDEIVDLRSLLIECSEAISANDHSNAKELIHTIKKHSSPTGDWLQRLAYYFADGLEARLAGTANEIYSRIVLEKLTIVDTLKAFRMFVATSPCRRAQFYFANQTILNNISKQTQKVHIISYGIRYGFQWPSFFEHLSTREGTHPKIRVTIVEVPEPGFRPTWRVDLIGRRLADYAKSFNIPFEYESIASKWEDVKVEDLKIANDELVIVYCVMHSEKVSDEAKGTDSPRDHFLNTIREIKPHIFIHSVFNASYNSPFFPTRFRAALSFYSSLFEMLDCNLPRDNPERLIIERNFLMPPAINAIAFEGPDRVERPETYRQWHTRKLRAGLVQLPVDPMIEISLKEFVRKHYHKDFVIDADSGWLLVGWKGRTWYGLSTWKAKEV